MAASLEKFTDVLTKALKRISTETKTGIEDLQIEIGLAIGKRGGSSIERWRKRSLPSKASDIVLLAKELVKRGGLRNRGELETFLVSCGYGNSSVLSDELFPQEADVSSGLLYKRLKMDVKRQISLDGKVTSFYRTEIQATTDFPLQSIRHRRTTPEGKFESWRLEFIPGQRDHGGEMRKRILSNSEKLLEWIVVFDPPLRKNEKASYSHIQTCWGAHAISYEECNEQFVAGHSRGKYEYWRIKMIVPTENLRMILEFPPNYLISLPPGDGFSVYFDASEHLPEKAKLMNQKSFSRNFNNETNQYIFELTVQPAVMGLAYGLLWIPPRASSINP